jgi:sigma-B regulation protein RsbU (phosphoserine phosphatase)
MTEIKKVAILDTLRIAFQRETEAFNYYTKAAQKAPFRETRVLLLQMAEEERKHRYFITREIQKIRDLLSGDGGVEAIEGGDIHYTLPTKVEYSRLTITPGVDAAVLTYPAELVGGDYIDSIELLRDGNIPASGILLCDVMGHTMQATELKAAIKTEFGQMREDWIQGKKSIDMNDPASVMKNLNQKLAPGCLDRGQFITSFYAILDPSNKIMQYASAGHEPPILIRANGDYYHMDETNLILCAAENTDYETFQVPIESKDVLVFFSDGITEACNNQEEMFERQCLYQTVQKNQKADSREITESILQRLKKFLGDLPMTDDFTLAVFKIK